MNKRNYPRESARRILWTDREALLEHWGHDTCLVWETVMEMCDTAGWTRESYICAIVFDAAELLVEVTK